MEEASSAVFFIHMHFICKWNEKSKLRKNQQSKINWKKIEKKNWKEKLKKKNWKKTQTKKHYKLFSVCDCFLSFLPDSRCGLQVDVTYNSLPAIQQNQAGGRRN